MEKITRVDRDILYTKFLLDGKQHNWYDKIYYSTNEDLESLLDVFDVEGKDVLSVTGSGDQAFHFHSKKANNVDLFDINRLTIHYYYLRVWVLNHLDNYYPNMDFASYIEELLRRVIPTTEEENISLLYWKRFIKEIPKLFMLLEELTKVELPPFIEKFVNDELPQDYKYDYFKENPDQLMFHRAICYNLYDLSFVLYSPIFNN